MRTLVTLYVHSTFKATRMASRARRSATQLLALTIALMVGVAAFALDDD
jgi:hypothetical protein